LSPGRSRAALLLAAIALALGVIDGLVFLGFEWVVKHGTDWLWNDVVDSDDVRWRVVPLALVLSIALSALMRGLGQPRWTAPHMDPLGPAEGSGGEPPPAPALPILATILLAGAAGLVAGASLGPEAPLVGLATGLGAWAAARVDLGAVGRVLVLASAGALLVAFFGSLIPIAIPLVIVYQRTRRLQVAAVLAIVLAGLAAWGTLWLVHGDDHGYGSIPSAAVHARDYVSAVVLGVIAVAIGALLRWFVKRLAVVTERIDDRAPWWVAAAIFGLVLGALYLAGGQTVQFSGSEGSAMLLSGDVHYGTWALAGIAVVKLAATAWSLTAGYRGGLVFPSVFVGVAVSLLVAGALPDLAGPGVLLGSVAGLLVEMTAPMLGVVMLLALLPAKLLPLGIAGAVGAIAGRFAVERLSLLSSARPAARRR
jgi:H+/Cl- antiporter ClcA